MPLKNGDVFAGFVIERFLGSGAMGEVYLARHPRLPRLDALKVLPAALTGNAEFRRRFEREADLAATLWHQHIVGIHDRGEFDGQLWISMDYVEGTDAGRLLSESYPTGMPVRDVFDIVTAVADALDFAHERQLLHRDVKPTNILLTSPKSNRRRILLADFGVARRADEATGLTGTNMSVGSVGYAAPEQLKGERLDGRADQYGLAVTAFHLLTARMPFQHSNPAVVISKQLTAAVPRLSEYRPDLANLDRVLSVALAKDPNQRYPHCLDFAEALRRENTRSYTRPVVTSADATRPLDLSRFTPSTLDETRAMRLPHAASAAPDETRAMRLRSGALDETRAMKLRPPRSGAPGETRAMRLRSGALDETRAMKLRSGAPDETRAMRLRPAAAAPPQPPADAAESVSTPAVRGARHDTVSARPAGSGPVARPAPKKSPDSEFRKAVWILLVVLLLMVTVIAAAVVYWKVTVTGARSPHPNVTELSTATAPSEIAIQTRAGRTTYAISNDIT